jgi:protein TonB
MTEKQAFQSPEKGGFGKWLPAGIGVIMLIAFGWFGYSVLTDVDGVAMKEAPPTMVDMLPPPPPPPPPPPEPPPPEPTDQPTPNEAPTPDQPAPTPMQIDGPAQAGGDAYGMQAGKGSGMAAPGGPACVGTNCGVAGTDRFWGRNISSALESHIEKSKSVNVDAFISEYDIWVNASGTLTQARLVKSSGNGKLDQTVLALLESARGLKPPPPSIRMPQRVKVGRKRF